MGDAGVMSTRRKAAAGVEDLHVYFFGEALPEAGAAEAEGPADGAPAEGGGSALGPALALPLAAGSAGGFSSFNIAW